MISDMLMARFEGEEEWHETTWSKDEFRNDWNFEFAAQDFAKEQFENHYRGDVELDYWHPIVEVTDQAGTTKKFKIKGYYEPEFNAEELE